VRRAAPAPQPRLLLPHKKKQPSRVRTSAALMPDVSLETILVAVIAGLGGGLAGTWLQIRHEREEAFRERLINAADDLSTGLIRRSSGSATRTRRA
jgi:hypothetical protein